MSSHIEINGRRYDAITGKVVGEPVTMKQHHHLDSIIAPSSQKSHHALATQATAHDQATKPATPHHTPGSTAPVRPSRPSMHDVRRPAATPERRAHTPQPTRTLMRHAVAKPETAHPSHLKAQSEVGQLAKDFPAEVTPKFSAASVDNQRLKHAKVIPKSKLISHYNPAAGAVVPVAPQPAPVSQPAIHFSSHAPSPVHRQSKTTAELLQHAIDQATSHQQPAPRVRRTFHRGRRIASVSSLAVVSLLLFGFVLRQNMPNLKLDLASSRAGFAASLPANQPAGYSLSNLNANTGQVAAHFHSNTNDGRNYTITEKPSGWDSATLRDSFVSAASNNKYQTETVAGRTLYLYGQQNVTWVNGSVWYLVTSDGALSNQQLIAIATSL